MKILYLYSELMGYQAAIFKEYVAKFGAEVHVIHWDRNKLTPYAPPAIENVFYYNRSNFSTSQLKAFIGTCAPDIIYVSGWMDKGYLVAIRSLKRAGIPIVTGFDDIWLNSIKQRLAALVFPFIKKIFFSHAWVAGPRQYEFAKRLGFKENEIIFNLLSGDTDVFDRGVTFLDAKSLAYPKKFLYVGTFREIKGTDVLIDAFRIYKTEFKGDWQLVCIGNGRLKTLLDEESEVEVVDFTTPDKLIEFTRGTGAFILPSRLDQWGVVVHEFAAAGMPLILSENVGARSTFLIDNYNGLTFRENSAQELAKAMHRMSTSETAQLVKMGQRSHVLAKKIDTEISAASFISLIPHARHQ